MPHPFVLAAATLGTFSGVSSIFLCVPDFLARTGSAEMHGDAVFKGVPGSTLLLRTLPGSGVSWQRLETVLEMSVFRDVLPACAFRKCPRPSLGSLALGPRPRSLPGLTAGPGLQWPQLALCMCHTHSWLCFSRNLFGFVVDLGDKLA